MRAYSKLHPKTSSALEFICTSMESSVVVSEVDYSEEEATVTLEQVSPMWLHYVKTLIILCNIGTALC